jgi:hypothetical protein
VTGLPTDKSVRVRVNVADEAIAGPAKQLSTDILDADYNSSMIIEVHKNRWIAPTYGGIWGLTKLNAFAMLRPEGEVRRKLSVLLTSSARSILVGVDIGTKGASGFASKSALIDVKYERWGFETGGFIAFSNLSDYELLTMPADNSSSKVKVLGTRRTDRSSQDTGIFLNLIPRNYPYIGIGLGLATNSGHNPSVYLGPTVRLIGLGDRGLASLSVGVVDRQVKSFPHAITNETYSQDNNALKEVYETRFGYYLLINLGFTFGQIGNNGAVQEGKQQ